MLGGSIFGRRVGAWWVDLHKVPSLLPAIIYLADPSLPAGLPASSLPPAQKAARSMFAKEGGMTVYQRPPSIFSSGGGGRLQ